MSVFVIDNELGSSIRELAQIIDGLNENDEFSQAITKHIADNGQVKDKKALIPPVYEASKPELMKKLNDKEFESTFNLIIYVLNSLWEGNTSAMVTESNQVLIKNLVKTSPPEQLSLRDRKSIKATSILSELTLIFNLLPSTSPVRVIIIQTIVDFFKDLQLDFKLLQGSFSSQLIGWLVQAENITSENVKKVFWEFIFLDKSYNENSLKLINTFTKQFEITSVDELHNLIKFTLNSDVVDLSFLINNHVSKALITYENDDLVKLFNQYLAGDAITSNPYNFPNLEFKSKLLSLCKFFENSNKYEFKFNEIPVNDQLELEVLLINCIKFKLIEGKLDQLNGQFNLTRVNKFILPNDAENISKNLESIKQNLNNWKQSLINVNDVVQNFRENIK